MRDKETDKVLDTFIREDINTTTGDYIKYNMLDDVIHFYERSQLPIPEGMLKCAICYSHESITKKSRFIVITETIRHYTAHFQSEYKTNLQELKKLVSDPKYLVRNLDKNFDQRCKEHFKMCKIEGCKDMAYDHRYLIYLPKEQQEEALCQYHYWQESIKHLQDGTAHAFSIYTYYRDWSSPDYNTGKYYEQTDKKNAWINDKVTELEYLLKKREIIKEKINPPVVIDLNYLLLNF